MHPLSTVLVLAGLVSNLLTVQGREDGHVARENCKKALQAETTCSLDSAKCICNYLDNNDLSHWTRELCDEADISIKSLYKDLCTDHPFLFPHRASAPMVRVGDASSSDDDNSPETESTQSKDTDTTTPFSDKMSSLIAFPSSSPVSTPSSIPIASAVAMAKAAGMMGGDADTGVHHPPNIHNRALQPLPRHEQEQEQAETQTQAKQTPYTDATGHLHMPIVYKTVTTTHTRTECLCGTGPGGASASAAILLSEGDTTSPGQVEMGDNSVGVSAAAEDVPTPTESPGPGPVPSPAPAPAPAAPTSTMLIGSPSLSAAALGSSHGVLASATSTMSSTTRPVSQSDLDSETLAEAVPTGVDPQRGGAGEVEEDGSRTTHAYASSAAGRVHAYGGGGGVVGVVGVMAVLML